MIFKGLVADPGGDYPDPEQTFNKKTESGFNRQEKTKTGSDLKH